MPPKVVQEEALKNLKATNAAFASTLRMGRPVSPPANVQAYAGDRRTGGMMEEAGEYMSIRSRMHTYMQTYIQTCIHMYVHACIYLINECIR